MKEKKTERVKDRETETGTKRDRGTKRVEDREKGRETEREREEKINAF